MPTTNDSDKITLCISLNAKTDKDILAWCNAQSNISASFRAIIRQSIRHAEIMEKLRRIETAISAIKTAEITKQKPRRKKVHVDPETLQHLSELGNF